MCTKFISKLWYGRFILTILRFGTVKQIKGGRAMGKKVVVITFVILLELAFVIIMRGDFQSEALSQVSEPGAQPPVLIARRSETPPQINSDEVAAKISYENPEELERSRLAPVRTLRSIGNRNRTKRKPDLAGKIHSPTFRTFTKKESPVKLSDTIIWIEKPTLAQNVQADVHSPRKAVDPRKATNYSAAKIVKKKRSGFSRIVPIVRKPYDWLKALAVRLN
jgi:hypothetical protein